MTARIVNIRGTSGSGKTTLIRLFRDHVGGWLPVGQPNKPIGYTCADGTMVVGPYENTCGGCDAVKTQDEIGARVRAFAHDAPRVLMEGLLMSHLFGRWAALSEELQASGLADGITFAFLDTPLETCLARVQARRDARGATKPFNPTITTNDWGSVRRTADKFRAAGLRVVALNHADPLPDLLGALGYPRDLPAVAAAPRAEMVVVPARPPAMPRNVADALSLGL